MSSNTPTITLDKKVLPISTKTPLMCKRNIILTIPHPVMIPSKCNFALRVTVELI